MDFKSLIHNYITVNSGYPVFVEVRPNFFKI